MEGQSLKARYEQLRPGRSMALERARAASKYTLPSLLPPEGHTTGNKLYVPYSSFGARCVNSLTAKLVLSLFPARAPFFRYIVPDEKLEGMGLDPKAHTEVDEALAKMERRVSHEIEISLARPTATEAMKHLIVAGNVLVYVKPDNSLKVFALTNYVVKRSPEGTMLEAVALEKVSPTELDPDLLGQVKSLVQKDKTDSADDTLSLYTGVRLENGKYVQRQEVEGVPIPDSESTYPADNCPWMALRWNIVDGDDYGRGHVEDYIGDLVAEEGLSAAITKTAAAAAKLVFVVKPGITDKRKLSSANTGDVIDGNPDDIGTMQSARTHDMRVPFETRQSLRESLAYAFLMNQAIQRDAERVTAEEIRFMANELDSTLGGIYSSLSVEFQRPYLRRVTRQMERQGKLPSLPDNMVTPVITTGIEALGRGAELGNLREFVKDVVELGGPEALSTYLNFDDLMKRLAAARQIDPKGLIKTADEVAAEQQQRQAQAMVETLGPNAVNQMGKIAAEGMNNG